MPDESLQDRRRREILVASAAVFGERGYTAATMGEVAHRAGLSKGSIYNYFQSKRELFVELFRHETAESLSDVAGMFAGRAGPAEMLRGLLDYWTAGLPQHVPIGRTTLEFWATAAREGEQSDLSALIRSAYDPRLELLAGLIVRGMEMGEFRPGMDPRAAGTFIGAVLDGLLVHAILNIGVEMDAAFRHRLAQGVLVALGAPWASDGGAAAEERLR